MTIIKIENRIDTIIRDCKNWGKGFVAGSLTTVCLIGYGVAKKRVEELKKEDKNKEES